MRKLTLTCLIIAAFAGGKAFAIGLQPVQPASVQPAPARQVKYVYDPGEDLDEKYVPQPNKIDEPVPAAAAQDKDDAVDEQQAAPAVPAPASIVPAPRTKVPALQTDIESDYGACDSCNGNSCGSCDSGRGGWCECAGDFTLDSANNWQSSPWNIGG